MAQYSLTVQNHGLNQHSIIHNHPDWPYCRLRGQTKPTNLFRHSFVLFVYSFVCLCGCLLLPLTTMLRPTTTTFFPVPPWEIVGHWGCELVGVCEHLWVFAASKFASSYVSEWLAAYEGGAGVGWGGGGGAVGACLFSGGERVIPSFIPLPILFFLMFQPML